MCYLCLKDDPFAGSTLTSSPGYKRRRAAEIKRLLREAEEHGLCNSGDETAERLKEEQYILSREL